MKRPVEPHELSGLLDGELDPQRVTEIRCAIEVDAQLRAEFDRLSALDHAWSAAVTGAAFRPRVSLPAYSPPVRLAVVLAVGLLILVAARLVPKMMLSFASAVVVSVLVLAVLMVILTCVGRRTPDQALTSTRVGPPKMS